MKWTVLILLPVFLLSCKNDKETAETPVSEPKKPSMTSGEHLELINEKLKLEDDLNNIIAERSQSNIAEIEKAKARLGESQSNLWTIRANHPKLQAITAKLADWNLRLRQVQKDKDANEIQLVSGEIAKLNAELEALAKEQPEVVEARQEIEAAQKNLHEIRRKFAGEIPEARDLLKTLEEIDEKLLKTSR